MKNRSLVIVGSGNIAEQLGSAFYIAGIEVLQVYSRNKVRGRKLAKKFHCSQTSDIVNVKRNANFYMIALSDDALKDFSKKLNKLQGIVFQTSGSVSLDIWKNKNYGLIWPIASINRRQKEEYNWSKIPFVVDGNNKMAQLDLKRLVKSLGAKTYNLNENDRMKLHLSAVVVNNFRHHLLHLTSNYLTEENVEPALLDYLVHQSMDEMTPQKLKETQTGPARRGDKEVIKNQMRLLKDEPHLKKIYKILSESIARTYEKEL